MTDIGSNSGHRANAGELRKFVERFERLAAEKQELSDMQAVVRSEAKAAGYDTKAFAEIIRRRKRDRGELEEHLAIVDLYCDVLGVFG
jgi:uncharacterized protein (UPF0335 family)